MTSAFSWQNSISFCPASFRIPRPNLPVAPGVSWLPTFAFQSPIMKRTSFLGVGSKRSCRSSSVSSVHSLSRVQLCDPMNRSMPCLPLHHQLPEFTQTHVHRVCDAIQPSHPLSSPFLLPPIPPRMSQLFAWGGQSIGVSALVSFLPKNTQGWSPLKCKSEWSEVSSHTGQIFKSLQVTNAQEGVEQREPSYTVGGNVSWCTHCGKQYESSSEN